MRFNPPPEWPQPPEGWIPPAGWNPDPSWPDPPEGWQLWVPDPSEPHTGDGRGDSGDVLTADATAESVPSDPLGATAHNPSDAGSSISATSTSTGESEKVLLARIRELERALAVAQSGGGDNGVVELSDQRVLQEVGIYRYHHPLEDAAAYRSRLEALNRRIDEFVKTDNAVMASDMFTFDGSLAKGRKMTTDFSRLMLRAYNAEADNCVRSLRSGNVRTAKARLERAMASIERLGAIMEMRVNPEYHEVRIEELELTADFQMKVQEEKERAREERAELREQQRVEKELAAERERLDKERTHYVGVLAALRDKGDDAAVAELEGRLHDIDAAIEANDYRAANIRAGYIYVISNIGALGSNVVKIGMTRRLEPRDRVRELGDASVPFLYDTHALFFSEDAVSLENELHKAFADRRVNMVNERREFFFATPAEVREILVAKVGGLLEFNEDPEAPEYFQSRGHWPEVDR